MPAFATVSDYLDSLPAAQREITDALLPLVEAALPGAGAVWHGHPVWSLGPAPGKSPVCYLKAYGGHVAFGHADRAIVDPVVPRSVGGTERQELPDARVAGVSGSHSGRCRAGDRPASDRIIVELSAYSTKPSHQLKARLDEKSSFFS